MKILFVYPVFPETYWSFTHALAFEGRRSAFPPLGLLTVSAMLPETWERRLTDLNVEPLKAVDIEWADIVFISAMIVQKESLDEVIKRCKKAGKRIALGGPYVSTSPDLYPEVDFVFIGETETTLPEFVEDLERKTPKRIYKAAERPSLHTTPVPDFGLIDPDNYSAMNLQYSRGCPFQCEFCDIPGLYGRNPRLKTPQQIIAELDKLRECGVTGSVYFVDDNFIGNRKAALDLLPHLVEWQKRTGYVMRLACEATLNIAKRPEILEKMREAYFVTVFCGIETPDPDALKAMQKDHNMMVPILEGIHTINSYGIEVVSGIIMGLDTDKPETGEALIAFVDETKIPLLTINLLQALPQTPLWDRLEREGRLIHDEGRDSNVDFRLPYEQVISSWRKCMEIAYQP